MFCLQIDFLISRVKQWLRDIKVYSDVFEQDPFGQKFRFLLSKFSAVKWNRKIPEFGQLREVAQNFRNERIRKLLFHLILNRKFRIFSQMDRAPRKFPEFPIFWKTSSGWLKFSKWTYRKRLFHLILQRKSRNFLPKWIAPFVSQRENLIDQNALRVGLLSWLCHKILDHSCYLLWAESVPRDLGALLFQALCELNSERPALVDSLRSFVHVWLNRSAKWTVNSKGNVNWCVDLF